MNRIGTIAALAGAVALLALGTACFETSVESENLGDEPRSISVSGTGEARAEPDIATMTLGVEAYGRTVAEARGIAATAADDVLGALRDSGVEDRDVRTTHYSIDEYYNRDYSPARFDGYTVSNVVVVTVRDIEGVGELIDVAAAAGGDVMRFHGLSFGYSDPAPLAVTARELAVEDARAKAEELAELTGVTLGEPLEIEESGWSAPLVAEAVADAGDGNTWATRTPISPGTSGISVTVNVVWAIK